MEPQAFDDYGYSGKWRTMDNGEHIFIRTGESFDTALMRRRLARAHNDLPNHFKTTRDRSEAKTKMTPAEKIASVHIDRTRDNILPELGELELKSVGATKSKPVLVKKNIIDRNAERHKEISDEDFETIIATALYDSPEVFRASSIEPYYHFAKFVEYGESGTLKMGLCLLDVSESKECFEVVHAYVVEGDGFERAKNSINKKD